VSILKQAELLSQNIYAITVNPTHVHIVAEYIPHPIGNVVAYYKNAARLALKAVGRNGRLWSRGYDKRFCFDEDTLNKRIKYVESHNPV
jgi:hypothetical protein